MVFKLVLLLSLVYTCFAFQPSSKFFQSKVYRNKQMNLSVTSKEVWLKCKEILPPVVHGAWKSDAGNENPLGAMYNLLFVRIPTLLAGAWYLSKLLNDNEFLMYFDFGLGPFNLPPAAVALVFIIILL